MERGWGNGWFFTLEVAYKNLLDYDESIKSYTKPSSQSTSSATAGNAQEQTVIQNCNLPWQQLLVPPSKQVIVVERMHSGAKRHVVLDFGDSVSLTDIILPSCSDLVSLTIDVWLFGEEVDSVRLVTSTDIGTKNLILNDLQPPPLCRFMRVSSGNSRLQTGLLFFAHWFDLGSNAHICIFLLFDKKCVFYAR